MLGVSVFFAAGFSAFLFSHLVLVIGICAPITGLGGMMTVIKCRSHISWAVALQTTLLLATFAVLIAVVTKQTVVLVASSIYIGLELCAAWALLARYGFYSFESSWRQIVAAIGMHLFIFSDLVIVLKGYISKTSWRWDCFTCERLLYMLPYYSALVCLRFSFSFANTQHCSMLVPICGYTKQL